MSKVLLNILRQTKIFLNRIYISLIFLQSLIFYNIPIKSIDIKDINIEFDFINKIINFFRKNTIPINNENANKQKKNNNIHIKSINIILDFEDYETYNSYYNIYRKLISEEKKKWGIVYNFFYYIFVFLLKLIIKNYYINIEKIQVKIFYNYKHRHSKICDNIKDISKGKTKYYFIFRDISISPNNNIKKEYEYDNPQKCNDTDKENIFDQENELIQINARTNQDNDKASNCENLDSHKYLLFCKEFNILKECNNGKRDGEIKKKLYFIKNIFYYFQENKILIPLMYMNLKECELKEILFLSHHTKVDYYLKDLINVAKKFSFTKNIDSNNGNYNEYKNKYDFFFHLTVYINKTFININLKDKIIKGVISSTLFNIKTNEHCDVYKRSDNNILQNKFDIKYSSTNFELSFMSFVIYTEKNFISLNLKNKNKEQKYTNLFETLCNNNPQNDVLLNEEIDKCHSKYNINNSNLVYCKYRKFFNMKNENEEKINVFKKNYNKCDIILSNIICIFEVVECINVYNLIQKHCLQRTHLREVPKNNKFSLLISIIKYTPFVCVRNISFYINKNINKLDLIYNNAILKNRDDELGYYNNTVINFREEIIKIEIKEICNIKGVEKNYAQINIDENGENTIEQDHSSDEDNNQRCIFYYEQDAIASFDFLVKDIIVKSVYLENNTLYEYNLNDKINIALKIKNKENEYGIVTIYFNNSTWYLLPEHVNFFYYIYSIYCTNMKKYAYLLRNPMRKKVKRITEIENNFPFFVNVIANNCNINLFCISEDFKANTMGTNIEGKRVTHTYNNAINNELITVKNEMGLKKKLKPIKISFDLKYILKIESEKEEIRRFFYKYYNYFFLGNVNIRFNYYKNLLKNVLVFKNEKARKKKDKSLFCMNNQGKIENNYDLLIKIVNKNIYVNIFNKAKILFINCIIYQIYIATRRIVYLQDTNNLKMKESIKKFKLIKKKRKNNIYNVLLKKLKYPINQIGCTEEIKNYSENNYTLGSGYNHKHIIYRNIKKYCNSYEICRNNFLSKITSKYNNYKSLKYLIQIKIKSKIHFISFFDDFYMTELRSFKNSNLQKNQYKIDLDTNVCIYYFDLLCKNNVRANNFLKLYIDFYKLQLDKYTSFNKIYNVLNFMNSIKKRHEQSKEFSFFSTKQLCKIFSYRNLDRIINDEENNGYFTIASEIKSFDFFTKFYSYAKKDDKYDIYYKHKKSTNEFNTNTKIYGNKIYLLYKTNDFFTFLNKYILTDFLNLFSSKHSCEMKVVNLKKNNYSQVYNFNENEVKDIFSLRDSMMLKQQALQPTAGHNNYVADYPGSIDEKQINNYKLYKIRQKNMKAQNGISLNKYKFTFNDVTLFVPSIHNNRNVIIIQNSVHIKNKFVFKKKENNNTIQLYDKIFVYFLNNICFSNKGNNSILKNVNMLLIYYRNIIYKTNMFGMFIYGTGNAYLSPENFTLVQNVVIENFLNNNVEYFDERQYIKSPKNIGNGIIGNEPNCKNVEKWKSEKKDKLKKSLNVVIHLIDMHIFLESDKLKSRISYIFIKYCLINILKYLNDKNKMITNIKSVVPLILNYTHKYPYDIIVYYKKIKNKNSYLKYLINMKDIKNEKTANTFSSFIKTKINKYNNLLITKKNKIIEIFYHRYKNDTIGCNVENHIFIKMKKIYTTIDAFQLFNFYNLYFVDDKNLFIYTLEKCFQKEYCSSSIKKKKINTWATYRNAQDCSDDTYIGEENTDYFVKKKINILKKTEKIKRPSNYLIYMYENMVKLLTSNDFNSYDYLVHSNNIYKINLYIEHAHIFVNLLLYEHLLKYRNVNNSEQTAKIDKSNKFGITYKGCVNFLLLFNLRKSHFFEFLKKKKHIIFNSYFFDKIVENDLTCSEKISQLSCSSQKLNCLNSPFHPNKYISEELEETIFFKCKIHKKNSLYLLNNSNFYCISKNINIDMCAKKEKVIYFNNNIKMVKYNKFYFNNIFLNDIEDKNIESSQVSGNDLYDIKISIGVPQKKQTNIDCLKHVFKNYNSLFPIDNTNCIIENMIKMANKNENTTFYELNSDNQNMHNNDDLTYNNIKNEKMFSSPKYINVNIKNGKIKIRLKDMIGVLKKIYELNYCLDYYEEINLIMYKQCEKSIIGNSYLYKLNKRKKEETYLTMLFNIIINNLSVELFETVNYFRYREVKKIRIAQINIKGNYNYISSYNKDEIIIKRHDLNCIYNFNFFKNNIFENFVKNMQIHFVWVKSKNENNFFSIFKNKPIDIFLSKNIFRKMLYLYEGVINSWNNHFELASHIKKRHYDKTAENLGNKKSILNLYSDKSVIINKIQEKAFSYQNKDILKNKEKKSKTEILHLKGGEHILFSPDCKKYTKNNNILLYNDCGFYNLISNVCIYNNTNLDIIFLHKSYKYYKHFLYAKKKTYISPFDLENDYFFLFICYKKKLYMAQSFSKELLQNKETNEYSYYLNISKIKKECMFGVDPNGNVRNSSAPRIFKKVLHFKNVESLQFDNTSIYKQSEKKEDKKEVPIHKLYNNIQRKYIKIISNNHGDNDNIKINTNNENFVLNIILIENYKNVYIYIDKMISLKNMLPLQICYTVEGTKCVINKYKTKEIYFKNIDLNGDSNILVGNKLKVVNGVSKGVSKNVGDVDKNFPNSIAHYVNVIKKNNCIILTCQTLIYFYSFSEHSIEINKKKIYFLNSKTNYTKDMTIPSMYNIKNMKCFVGVFNEPFENVALEKHQINNITPGKSNEICLTHTNENNKYLFFYKIDLLNGLNNNKKNIGNTYHHNVLSIYPKYIIQNETEIDICMFSIYNEYETYKIERSSTKVLNTIMDSGNKNYLPFFFKIKNRNEKSNNYLDACGPINIAKEGSYIFSLKKNKPILASSTSQNKQIKSSPHFLNLKFRVHKGEKCKYFKGPFSNSIFIKISKHKSNKKKLEKYITYINNNSNITDKIYGKNNIMNIYKYIEKNDDIKKIYIYNNTDFGAIVDIMHYIELVYIIKNEMKTDKGGIKLSEIESANFSGLNNSYDKDSTEMYHSLMHSNIEKENDSENEDEKSNGIDNNTFEKITKDDINNILNNKHLIHEYLKKNKKNFRYLKNNSILFLPLRKNKNIKNFFLLLYPFKQTNNIHICRISLENKINIVKFVENNKSIFFEFCIIQKKNKILIKFSQYLDNVIQIKGKVNLNLLSMQKMDNKQNKPQDKQIKTKKIHTKKGARHQNIDICTSSNQAEKVHDNFLNYILNRKKYITLFMKRFNKSITPSLERIDKLDMSQNGELLCRLKSKGSVKNTNISRMQKDEKCKIVCTANCKTFAKYDKNCVNGNERKKVSRFIHHISKDVTFYEHSKKKIIIFSSQNEKKKKNSNCHIIINNDININIFSSILIKNVDISKQYYSDKRIMSSVYTSLMEYTNVDKENENNNISYEERFNKYLFKKKKNAHIYTISLTNLNFYFKKNKINSSTTQNRFYLNLDNLSIVDFSTNVVKNILFKSLENRVLDEKGDKHVKQNNENKFITLDIIYKMSFNSLVVQKFELLFFCPLRIYLSLVSVENFNYCCKKFLKKKKKTRNAKSRNELLLFSPINENPSRERRIDKILKFQSKYARNAFKVNTFYETLCNVNNKEKERKIKIYNLKISNIYIVFSFSNKNTYSIERYKNEDELFKTKKKNLDDDSNNFIFNFKLAFLNQIKNANFEINSLDLKKIKEKNILEFVNYILDFYIKELYKNLFFYMTKMNTINKYIHNYSNFFNQFMDKKKMFNLVDISSGLKYITHELHEKSNVYLENINIFTSPLGLQDGVREFYQPKQVRKQNEALSIINVDENSLEKDYGMVDTPLKGKRSKRTQSDQTKRSKRTQDENNNIYNDENKQFFTNFEDMVVLSDSNYCICRKKKLKINRINNKLYYFNNDKKVFIFDDSQVNYNNIDPNKNDEKFKEIYKADQKNDIIWNPKEAILRTQKKETSTNFNIFNSAIKNIGKDIMSSINYYLYDNNENDLKKKKKIILDYFCENVQSSPQDTKPEPPDETQRKTNEIGLREFTTFATIYKKGQIKYDSGPFRICNPLDMPLVKGVVIENYVKDKDENLLLLFCDEYIINLNNENRIIIKKKNIIKIEIVCKYFNLIFERDKSLMHNIKNIIKKNNHNFLGYYFDVLFKKKMKNEKKLIHKIKKNKIRIIYFLYYIFYFIYNYDQRLKKLTKSYLPNQENIKPTIIIFENTKKVFFSLSSIIYLNIFYFNVRDFLFSFVKQSS
ncbi:conserved Plasmodium protein, unknown function [Plasmodium chabaudi chabaudi]|uniref:Uncharacterized protein n=1 Tax=Plasmodium chabaudi chabaudi TaxID=31271 RepID=A0A4V0KAY2_PLACU|nr:conserved Plasmodium protein, unknown function [Plasmodium chabaudi chabaudi]VTZ70393.1 conserved Plasmodium protein, unknown function [Plasmodium chabaudi chabaudi]|eukprot:XP_016654651.1 conserved Plasmodium protein, unknown function [Plasmodium chabaudi chabaudi]